MSHAGIAHQSTDQERSNVTSVDMSYLVYSSSSDARKDKRSD